MNLVVRLCFFSANRKETKDETRVCAEDVVGVAGDTAADRVMDGVGNRSRAAGGRGCGTPPPAAAAENGAAKKPRGRLPAYYGKVVTDKQREQIYEIQAKFNEQIAKLQQQLDHAVDQT